LSSLELGRAALEAGNFDDARRHAEAVLARAPQDADALVLAGRVARAGIYLGASLDYFERAVLARPRSYPAYVELSRTYAWGGAYGTAQAILELALTRVEPTAESCTALADAFADVDPQKAQSLYERALALDPAMREAEFGLVTVLLRLGELDAARRYAHAAQSRSAADRHSLNLRAMVADTEGDIAGVQAILEQGAREHPDEHSFLYNLQATKSRRGLWREAERDLDALLERFPEDANGLLAKAAFLLRRGDFAEGYAAFEARRRLPDFPAARHAPVPRWDGGDVRGKRIVVLDEQGLGDSLMFVRFVPQLLERGAVVRYVCRQPLYSLYGGQAALTEVDVQPQGGARAVAEGFDCYATLLSLPHLLRVEDPGRPPYLVPPAELVEEWAGRLAQDGRPRVGIVWSANPNAPMGPERSTSLASLQPLLDCGDFSFFSLQLGGSDTLKDFPAVVDLAPHIYDFADTCAIVANLDVLVSVDTAAAHIAGAIGKPLYLMAPLDMDWRWGGPSAGTSFWYRSARIFRQRTSGDWDAVVAEVADAIKGNAARGRRFEATS
jgi:tetratricopeptide (TPR) repeat protein